MKKYRLKRKSRIRTSRISRYGFPDILSTILRYDVKITATVPAGTTGVYRFRGNSVYDPDYTATGGYPMMFLEYSNMYYYYRVRASSITVRAVLATSASYDTTTISVVPMPDLNVTNFFEFPRSKTRVMLPFAQKQSTVRHYATTNTMFASINPKNHFGYTGATGPLGTGSNPANQWFWGIYFDNTTNAAIAGVSFFVSIKYYVQFISKKTTLTGRPNPTLTDGGEGAGPEGEYEYTVGPPA